MIIGSVRRCVLPLCCKPQRRLQDCHVQRDHGADCDGHAAVPHATVRVHTQRCPRSDHHRRGDRLDRFPRGVPHLEDGQDGFSGVRLRVCRRHLHLSPRRPCDSGGGILTVLQRACLFCLLDVYSRLFYFILFFIKKNCRLVYLYLGC